MNSVFSSSFSFAALALVTGLGTVSCSKQEPEVLAKVDGAAITETTFRHWWSKAAPAQDTLATRQALLDKLIHRAQLVQHARASGLEQDSTVLEAFESLLIARLYEAELQPALAEVQVSEPEMRAVYEAMRETRFHVGERSRIAVLWFDTRGQQPLAARYGARLEEARSKLETVPLNEGFGALSIPYSEHRPSRFKGGQIGWVERDTLSSDLWRNAVAEIAATLEQPGEISPIIQRKEGAFLVRLMETAPPKTRSFESVQAAIKRDLLTEKREFIRDKFEQSIQQGSRIELHPEALVAISHLETRKPEASAFSHKATDNPSR